MSDYKYMDSIDPNSFIYDETDAKSKNSKQDNEFFNDDDYVPGHSVSVKAVKEDWQIYVNEKPFITIKGSRFTAAEKEFLKTKEGMLFLINGTKEGWKSVSEFSRQIKSVL